MVDRVDPSKSSVRVHQALHGYSDGHRMLACSSSDIKSRDAKTLLVMSDASGPGVRTDEHGYLTGYPLTESGVYALARTWSAPEMPRPGCVWTHTLLIDFADLAALNRMEILLTKFKRPDFSDNLITYGRTEHVGTSLFLPHSDYDADFRTFLTAILAALYRQPKSRVIQHRVPTIQEEIGVLRIWGQQWPKLRRTFRFCTQAFADRSTETEPFDLQFIPTMNGPARSSMPSDVHMPTSLEGASDWLSIAVADLTEGRSELRDFLRRAGVDLTSGREAFAPLVTLFALLTESSPAGGTITRATEIIRRTFPPTEGQGIRIAVAEAAMHSIASVERPALEFVLEHLELLAPTVAHEHAQDLGVKVWSMLPDRFAALLSAKGIGREIAGAALDTLPVNSILSGLSENPTMGSVVLEHRPQLLSEAAFWNLNSSLTHAGFKLLAREHEQLYPALDAMISAGRSDFAARSVQSFGRDAILRATSAWLAAESVEDPANTAAIWLQACVSDAGALARALSQGELKARSTLVAVARITQPDFVPNDYGNDPWWSAVQEANGEISQRGRQYLSAYLLTRGLGHRSLSPAELISSSFDDVYLAALHSQLANDAWTLIEPRLPSAFWLFDWDHCQRLRTAVVNLFVDRELSPLMFGDLTKSDAVFATLVGDIGRTIRGRAYLRRVIQALRDANHERFVQRSRVIEELIA